MEETMRSISVYLIALLTLSGCADIQHTSAPEQALNRNLLAGPGDVVLRIDKQRNLENAFGKSDVFGRRTNEGFIEIRFIGVESNGQIVLSRKDVQIITNETTMSRTPVTQTSGRANTTVSGRATDDFRGTSVNAAANTTYQETTISPSSDFHLVVPADAIPIRIASTDTAIPVEGYIIQIIRAAPQSLEYRITRQ